MSEPEKPVSNDLLDLRLLPSWLKEDSSPAQSYANFDGNDRPQRRDSFGGRDNVRRGPRPDQGSRPPQARQGRDDSRQQNRGPSGQRPPGGARPPQNRDGRPPGNRDSRQGNDPRGRRQDSRPQDRRQDTRPPRQEDRPAPVEIHFLPEEHALENVSEQLRSAPIAYPLFAVAKMFLGGPKRHHLAIKPLPDAKLFKLEGTTHLSTDRGRLEAIAFQELGEKYFTIEVTEAPEIKGNFTTVARSGLTGKVFGPTSHHSYQPAIHKEYEERFSRKMSFADYQRSIETTREPEAIEKWKNESRRIETYRLRDLTDVPAVEETPIPQDIAPISPITPIEETTTTASASEPPADLAAEAPSPETAPAESALPAEEGASDQAEAAPATESTPETPAATGQTFASPQEAENYFRKEILPSLIVETTSEIFTGQEARDLSDRRMAAAVRGAWEAEMRYPLGLVNAIRVKFNEQNLHIFKFKKRVLLISSLKPVWLDDSSESLSDSIRTVLRTIKAQPGIDRKGLSEKIVNIDASSTDEEKQARKTVLIGDLFWLVRQGNVIEFSDGTFDLPLGPKPLAVEKAMELLDETTPDAATSLSGADEASSSLAPEPEDAAQHSSHDAPETSPAPQDQ